MATRTTVLRQSAAARPGGWRYLFRPRPAGQAGPLLTSFSYGVAIVVALGGAAYVVGWAMWWW